MLTTQKNNLVTHQQYDPTRARHYVNQENTVLHCHHYTSLYTQLADDATLFDGKALLRDNTAETFWGVLDNYMGSNQVTSTAARIAAAEQYWAFCGMGHLRFEECSPTGGTVEMTHSHVDEGWVKKWGKRTQPVNFITQGYLAAAFSVIHDQPWRQFQVTETQSIVSGAEKSIFSITRK
jgi:hypothetical protein